MAAAKPEVSIYWLVDKLAVKFQRGFNGSVFKCPESESAKVQMRCLTPITWLQPMKFCWYHVYKPKACGATKASSVARSLKLSIVDLG